MYLSLAAALVILLAQEAKLALGLTLSRVTPKPGVDISHAYRHTGYIDQRVRRDAHAILNHELYHLRNVERSPAGPAASPVQQKAATKAARPAVVDVEKVTAATPPSVDLQNVTDPAPACAKALTAMNGNASNPSGLAVCYNVLLMNTTTGIFTADARLYKIASPTGSWSTLDMKTAKMSFYYLGANHIELQHSISKRDGLQLFENSLSGVEKRAAALPQSMHNTTISAQASPDVLPHLNNATYQQALTTPNITLTGKIANGSTLQIQLPSKDAFFVSGMFQDATTGNTTAAATKFVLPGTSLGIFPIGLIITSAWAGLFISVLAYGTFGRIQFRESYRRRMKRGVAGGMRTI